MMSEVSFLSSSASYGGTATTNVHGNVNLHLPPDKEKKPTTPWNLPNSVGQFTGREEELKILKSALTKDVKGFIGQHIVGLGGTGKTSLAVKYAEKSTNYDFIAFFHANSQDSLFTEFKSLAIAFGMLPAIIAEISAPDLVCFVYQKLYEQYNQVLLIFDDAIDLKTIKGLDSYEKTVANYELPQNYANKIHWLITTKNQHFSSQMQVIKMKVFSIEEAREYIKKRLVNKEDDTLVDQLAKELGYLPLALSYATTYINMNSTRCNIEKYLKLYNTQQELKELLDTDIDSEPYGKTIYNAWKISMSTLNQTSLIILNHCAFLAPTLIPLSLIELINKQITKTNLYNALTELEKYSLIDSFYEERKNFSGIILHSLLQTVIRLSLTKENQTVASTINNEPLNYSIFDHFKNMFHKLIKARDTEKQPISLTFKLYKKFT